MAGIVSMVLRQQLQLDIDQVTVVGAQAAEWPDSCLGLPAADEACAEAITPGYRVVLEAEGQPYEYRTNQDGSAVRLASAPEPAVGKAAIEWQSPDSPCQTAAISPQGVAFGACGGPLMGGKLAGDGRAEELAEFVTTYASFQAETPAGRVTLTGQGTTAASPAEQRMVAEWARLVAQEAAFGRGGASWGFVLSWHREGGIAGFCDDLSVYITGEMYASACRGEQPQDLGKRRLTREELAQLYTWVDTLGAFEIEQTDPAQADAMTIRVLFTGMGPNQANDADKQAIRDFAAQLFASLSPQSAPATPVSGSAPSIAPSPATHPTALPPPPVTDPSARLARARVEIRAQPAAVQVGEVVTVTGRIANLGLAYYTLYLRDEPSVTINYDGQLGFQGFTGATFEFASASADSTQVEFVLRATQPGAVKAIIGVSGEVRLDDGRGDPNWAWSRVASSPVVLTALPVPVPAATPRPLRQIDLGGAPIRAWAWSPDGQTIAIAGDRSVSLYSANGSEQPSQLQTSASDLVHSIAFSPDSRMLAVGYSNGTLQVWDFESQSLVFALDDDPRVRDISSLVFSPDGAALAIGGTNSRASSSSDGIVRLLDLETRDELASFEYYGWVGRVTFNADGTLLGVQTAGTCGRGGGGVSLQDPLTGAQRGPAIPDWGDGVGVAFSPDGTMLAVGVQEGARCIADGGFVWLWDLAHEQALDPLPGYSDGVAWLAFSPDSTLLAGSDGQTLRLWAVKPIREVAHIPAQHGWLGSAAFSPDSAILAYQDGDTIQLVAY